MLFRVAVAIFLQLSCNNQATRQQEGPEKINREL